MTGHPFSVAAWAMRHGVTLAALDELRRGLGAHEASMTPGGAPPPPGASSEAMLEAFSQSQVRMEAPHKGVHLWRNNVGALQDKAGRWVRFGLANDSAQLNEHFKSSDLIGIRPVTITPIHVGLVIGQFVARECKRPGWAYKGTPREEAQANYIHHVQGLGGDAAFTDGPGSL
jgi:hypothetical protein